MKLQPLTFLACLSLPLAGCILMPDDDDDMNVDSGFDDDGYDGTDGEPEDDGTDDDDAGTTGGETDGESEGETDDGDDLECSANLFGDPSFEAGTPSEMWTEASALFGSPLCDSTCTTDDGAEPFAGDWWIWFGGMEEAETASMAQSLTFDATHAILSFQFSINSAAGAGEDVFAVKVDDDTVFMATDADWDSYDGYTQIEIDVSAYADGAEHTVTFEAEIAGAGLTNFFVDDVSLTECEDPAAGETGAAETDGDTDAGDADTDTDAGDADTDAGDADTDASDTDAGDSDTDAATTE